MNTCCVIGSRTLSRGMQRAREGVEWMMMMMMIALITLLHHPFFSCPSACLSALSAVILQPRWKRRLPPITDMAAPSLCVRVLPTYLNVSDDLRHIAAGTVDRSSIGEMRLLLLLL